MLNAMPRTKEFEVVVACPPHGTLEKKLAQLGIRTYTLDFGKYAFNHRPDWHFGFYLRFRRILVASRPDIVVVNLDGNTPLVTLAALRSGIPIVRFSRFEFKSPKRWIENYCWLKAAAVICPSEMVREQVLLWAPVSFHSRVERWYDPIHIPPNYADQEEKLRAELGLKFSKVIIFVGRLDPKKGIETALHAFSLIRKICSDIRFILVGDHDGSAAGADYASNLRRLTCQLGLDDAVSFLGYRNDVLALLALSSVSILPSESESFGMVLAEAWSVATPTVASDVGGCREITLASGGGRLFPVGNSDKLAKLTLEVLQDPALARSLALSGQAWVRKNCDPQHYASRFANLMLTLCVSKHP